VRVTRWTSDTGYECSEIAGSPQFAVWQTCPFMLMSFDMCLLKGTVSQDTVLYFF
jgi:hypothetical protein